MPDPHDPTLAECERACIGALVCSPESLRTVPLLRPRHFEDHRYGAVLQAVMAACEVTNAVPDSTIVLAKLRDLGLFRPGVVDGVVLADVITGAPPPVNVAWFAQRVLDAARRRALIAFWTRCRQLTEACLDEAELPERVAAMLRDAEGLTARLDVTGGEARPAGFSSGPDFLARNSADDPWIIPGLLREQERVMVIAPEAAGKSMVGRAVALAVAAGRHPLIPEARIPPQRTLLVDCENSEAMSRAKMRPMQQWLSERGDTGVGWSIWARPGGINVRDPDDAALLGRAVRDSGCRLAVMGPVYKMTMASAGERGDIAADRELMAVIDRLRAQFGIAVWLEHHAPEEQHGARKMRPYGTSLWRRWVDFGVGLVPDGRAGLTKLRVDLWKPRDEREWPSSLSRSSGWPWEATWDAGAPPWLLGQGPVDNWVYPDEAGAVR